MTGDELRLLRQALAEALEAVHPSDWDPPDDGTIATDAWALCTELGWDQAGLPDELGGIGDRAAPLVLLARACAQHRLPIPLVETALARSVLAAAGVEQPPAGTILTAVLDRAASSLETTRSGGATRVTGDLRRVPWGRQADRVLVPGADRTLLVVDPQAPGVSIDARTNLAGEARDHIRLDDAPATELGGEAGGRACALLEARGPLLRSAQIAAAIDRARALTHEHTSSRKQFGRPLAAFQLVGAQLAEMASQAALVEAMLGDAMRAQDAGTPDPSTTCLALVSAQAATSVARAAHQCHGAIGVTREYQLHHFTRRLWSWRDEAGSERRWCNSLGTAALLAPDAVWASTQPMEAEQ